MILTTTQHVLLPLVLLLASAPATSPQCPDLSEAKLLPGDEAPGIAGGEQIQPAIAAGAGGYLVVWMDHRAAFEGTLTNQGMRDLFAQRLDAQGEPLDALPFRLASWLGGKQDPAVAWNGENWLVVWENRSPTQFFYAAEVLAVRVSPQGEVLDDPPISVRKYQNSSSAILTVGTDGTNWIVVSEGTSGGEHEVRGFVVAPSGTMPNPSGSELVTASSIKLHFDLEHAGGELLLVWGGSTLVEGRRFAPNLAPLGPTFTIASGGANFPALATSGSDFLVLWEQEHPQGSSILGRILAPGGGVGASFPVASGGGGEYHRDPDVAWSGSAWLSAYESGLFSPGIRVARIASAGPVLDPDGVLLGQGLSPFDPVVASIGDGTAAVAWRDAVTAPPNRGDVFATAIAPGAQPGEAVLLSTSAPRQGFVDLASAPAQHLAAFVEEKDGTVFVMAQRLGPCGDALDPAPIALASGDDLAQPAAAWNGSVYLVVWTELAGTTWGLGDRVFGRRIGADGTLLDPAPFLVMEGDQPDVDAVGNEFLVAVSRPVTSEIRQIFVRRTDGDTGTFPDAEVGIFVGHNFARFPRVASFDDRWVVTWQRNFSHDDPKSVVRAAIVLADGTPLPDVLVGGSLTGGGAGEPDVGASGDVALIVWEAGSVGGDLLGRRLSESGAFLEGAFTVTNAPERQTQAAVTWNGAEFVVAWRDFRNAEAFFDERADVFSARVAESGAVLDPGGCAVSMSPDDETAPDVGGSGGDSLFAFGLFLPEAPYATMRQAFVCDSAWTILEGGITGIAGMPLLAGGGVLSTGGPVTFTVANSAPLSAAVHVFGFSQLALPLFGGALVPYPNVLLGFSTDQVGGASLVIQPGPTLPAGTTLWVQSFIADASTSQAFSATNAVVQAVP